MIFDKKIKIMSSFLISLLVSSSFYTLASSVNPINKNDIKKIETKSSLSCLKVLKYLLCPTAISLFFYKINDNCKYLDINIPVVQWYDQSCAIDSFLMLFADPIEKIIDNLDEEAMKNLDESTKLINCMIQVCKLFKDSKKTGEKAKINSVKLEGDLSIGMCLRNIIKESDPNDPNSIIWMSPINVFTYIFKWRLPKELDMLENKIKETNPEYKLKKLIITSKICEKSDKCYNLIEIEGSNSDKFLITNHDPGKTFPKKEMNLEDEKFLLYGAIMFKRDHYNVILDISNKLLSEELIKEGKCFIKRDSFSSKDSKCFEKDLISYEKIKNDCERHNKYVAPGSPDEYYFFAPFALYKIDNPT
ncbi:MAG: hypothetical protein FWC41_06295 [Firmicutes bacterium]|nr:hypothetical protein [Bacillota bacterium]